MKSTRPSPILLATLISTLTLGPIAQALQAAELAETPKVSEPSTSTSGSLPKAIDLRPTMEQWSLVPHIQGKRPTCSVFTVTSAIEFAAARSQGYTPRLSVEYLNWAGNQVTPQPEDGGFFSDLWKGFAEHGLCPEDEFTYQDKFDPALKPSGALQDQAHALRDLGLRLNWIKDWDVNTGLTPAQLLAIKQTLSRGWPVCGGFRWPKHAEWRDNTLQMCPADAVYDGHSVLLVGYRDDLVQLGGGVFLFRNTSGDGHDGAMPFAYALAYMNDAAWVEALSRSGPKLPVTPSLTPTGGEPARKDG